MSDQERQSAQDADTPPWLQAVPDEEDGGSAGLKGRTMALVAGGSLAVVAIFVAAIAVLYDDDGAPPVHVTAPTEPVREKPEDPGGLDVPHQDKAVFERGAGQEVPSEATLAPPPERPVEALPEETPEALPQAEDRATQRETATPSATAAEATVRAPAPAAQEEDPAPSVSPASRAESADQAALSAPAGPVFRIQLGAYGSQEGAARAWRTLRRTFSSELGTLTPAYEAVETSDRTLYRLRVGPVASQAAADTLCLALKGKGQGCIVIKP